MKTFLLQINIRAYSLAAFKRALLMSVLGLSLLAQAENRETLNIRTIAIPPYGINKQGELSGVYYDLVNTLATETGFKVSHQVYPYSRIMRELKSGHTDLTIMFRYKELEAYVTYIAPLPALQNVVMGISGSTFADVAELKGKRIGYLRGAKFSDLIDNDAEIVKIETVNFQQGIKMLDARRIEAIIGPLDPLLMAAQDLGFSASFFGEPLVVSQRTPWVQLSKKSQKGVSVKDLTSHFQYILERGDLDRLRMKYVPEAPLAYPEMPE